MGTFYALEYASNLKFGNVKMLLEMVLRVTGCA